ncbi:WD40-repeat-containing domain protein [Dichotomocladium elegans]|nr:WD40-repeat-containing domain protein [Dichotomocladium elegans]
MANKRSADTNDKDTESPTKKQALGDKSALDSILLPSNAHKTSSDNEDFRIITGTYERILYGINAFWEKSEEGLKVRLEPVFIVPAHTGCIRTVAVGGQYLASGSTDEIIRLYDVKKRKEFGSLGGQHKGDITDIQFYGRYMLTGSDDKTICVWRKKDWEHLKTLKGHKGRVNSIAIHPSEGLLVRWNAGGDRYAIMFDRQVNIYNVADAEVTTSISHRSRFLSIEYFTADDNKEYIITGNEDKIARIWDASTGECIAELTGHKLRVKALTVIVSKPEESDKAVPVLATVSSDGVIKCWDIQAAILKKEGVLLGQYDTKSRATCCTAHLGFHKITTTSAKADTPMIEGDDQDEGKAE